MADKITIPEGSHCLIKVTFDLQKGQPLQPGGQALPLSFVSCPHEVSGMEANGSVLVPEFCPHHSIKHILEWIEADTKIDGI